MSKRTITHCTLGEAMIYQIALSIEDGILAFHGFGQDSLKLKLPGGGGGCNLSCDAAHVTLWTGAHGVLPDGKGRRRYRLVEHCDFITSVGHRSAEGKSRADMTYRGSGPDVLITELAVFDFDESGQARLIKLYPDVGLDVVRENTGFDFPVHPELSSISVPTPEMVEFIRRLDPLKIHERELKPAESNRIFPIS